MSIIFHIMKEEYDRLTEAEQVYLKSIQKEIKGAPRIKHIGNKDYLYIEKRDGKKVVYEYIGKTDSPRALDVLKSVEKRRKDEKSLIKIRSDLKDVRKVLRGKI